MVQAIYEARDRAIKDPLLCVTFKRDAEVKLVAALRNTNVPPEAVALLRHFFGLDSDRPPPALKTLELLPCLDTPNRHRKLVKKLLWALFDPEALRWLSPEFFKVHL